MLNLFLQNNVYSFTAVIATFLAGIAIGSLVYSRFLSGIGGQVGLFVGLQVGIGVMPMRRPSSSPAAADSLFSRSPSPMTWPRRPSS